MQVELTDTSGSEQLISGFEQLIWSSRNRVEQSVIRRAIHEASVANPGPIRSYWAYWFVDAGRSLNLNLSRLTASIAQAIELADCGMTLVTLEEHTGRFLILTRGLRSATCHFWSDSAATESRSTLRRLKELLTDGDPHREVTWIAVSHEKSVPDTETHSAHLAHPVPIIRFWWMIKPEMTDIWVLFILSLVIGLLSTAVPIAGQQLVRTVTFGAQYQPIIVLSLILLLFLGFMGSLQALNVFVVELIQQRLFARTVADLSWKLPRADVRALSQQNGPELVTRFLEIATIQKVVAGLLVDGLAVLLTTAVGMTLLAFYHPFLLGYDLLLLGGLTFILLTLGSGGISSATRESVEKYRVAAWLQEMARCPLAFRLPGGAEFAIGRADRLTGGYLESRQRHFRVLMRQLVGLLAMQTLASTSLLGLGGYLVMHEQLTLGQLVAAELIVAMIVGAFAKLAKHIEGFFDLMASMDKLGHVLDLPNERGGHALRPRSDTPLVEISGAQFLPTSYNNNHEDLFFGDAHTLQIEQGQHLAVLGGSGSGKSYLANRLFGLESPGGELLRLFGEDVRELSPDSLRRQVALVRGVEILAGTIEENIHFGRTEVDSTAVREAMDLVGLSEELLAFADGSRTELTCDGSPLSGSQQLRLMLARALVGRPKLLVVDGLFDGLSDECLDSLLTKLQDGFAPWTLFVLTGRSDVAKRFARSVTLIPARTLFKTHFPEPLRAH